MIRFIAFSYSPRVRPWLSAMFAAIVFAILHRNAIEMTPDGWAYWQGSLSLLEGNGYRYFSGGEITDWPPLYSLYLACWISVLGPTGLSLILANGALVAAQAAGWIGLAQGTLQMTGEAVSFWGALLSAAFAAIFIPLWEGPALAHNLLYTILPFQAALALKLARPQDHKAARLAALTLTSALLLLTHNSGIVFVLAATLFVFLFAQNALLTRALFSTIVTAIPLGAWWAVRIMFDQDESHPVGEGRFSTAEYVQQAINGAGNLMLPAPLTAIAALGIAALIAWLCVTLPAGKKARWFPLIFTAVPFVLLIAIFNVTWIYDPLSDARFTLFIPLIVMPLAMMMTKNRAILQSLLAMFTVPVLAYRIGTAAFAVSQTPNFPNAVAANYVLSHEPAPGQLIAQSGGTILAAPPRYEWETQEEKPEDEEKSTTPDGKS
jgi:hypothetical protein